MSPGESISEEELAYHEAGHVVMAVLKRVAIKRVSIVPDNDGTMGRVTLPIRKLRRVAYLKGPDESFVKNPRASAPSRKTNKRKAAELFFGLAGSAALALHRTPPPLRSHEAVFEVAISATDLLRQQATPERENDASMAWDLAEKLREQSTPIGEFIAGKMVEAVLLLANRSNWRAVQSLVRELIKSSELSARRAKKIVKQALADNC
jgi:hypothetical protein